MNEHEIKDLLERGGDRAHPDVEALVGGGLARGVRRRRRSRVVTGIGALALVAVVGTGAVVSLGSGGGESAPVAADPAPPSAPADPPVTYIPGPLQAPVPATLAVTVETIPEAFASIYPGEVTTVPRQENEGSEPIVDFRWNGFGIRVGLLPETRNYPELEGVDPMRRCEFTEGEPCRPGPDGSALSTYDGTGPAADGGVSSRFATVYRADGWDVLVAAHNAPSSKAGPILADEPPFTIAQLVRAGVSDVWFE